jgi:hypothetical protein
MRKLTIASGYWISGFCVKQKIDSFACLIGGKVKKEFVEFFGFP